MNVGATDPPGARRPPVLVLGVGSELRRDDAAGRHVAAGVAARTPRTDVEVRSVHQLTPELADTVTGRRLVVVADADVDVDVVTVTPVTAAGTPTLMSHHLDAATLLGLAALFGTPPDEVVTVAVPAGSLTLGTELTPRTAGHVTDAVARVVALARRAGCASDVAQRS